MKTMLRLLVLATLLCQATAAMARPLTVHLAGDSTMAAKLPEKRPETGWGEALPGWFDTSEVQVLNHARNGRSTRTFIEEGRWSYLLSEMRPGDYVLIQFGHNDQSEHKLDRYTAPADFRANLSRFVADVRAREGRPVLLTPVVRRVFDAAGVQQPQHGFYVDSVREVAAATGTPLVDLYASSFALMQLYGAEPAKDFYLWLEPGANPNYPEGLKDDTHFSPMGAEAVAGLVAAELGRADIGLPVLARPSRHVIEQDQAVKREQPGPHRGGGESTGYSFFEGVDDLPWVVRKRVLHPGAAIGYHLHDKDEIYYVLAGEGELTMNGEVSQVGPGTAILTRVGDSHGLKQRGRKDLELMIVFPR